MFFAFAIVLQARPRSFGNGRARAVRHFIGENEQGRSFMLGRPCSFFGRKRDRKTLKHKENIL